MLRRPRAANAGSPLPVRVWIESRIVVLGVAAGLFATIFLLRQTSDDVADTIALLYVIPISLVALELGMMAGVASAAFALGLLGVGALTTHADLEVVGVLTRGVAYLAVGGAAGRFSGRMRNIQRRQALLLESGLALATLTRAEDLPATLAQDVRTLLGSRGARVELIDRTPVESGVIDEPLERVPIETRGVRYGTLAMSAARTISPEDRVTLGILALQAAMAAESQRQLQDARQRAVLRMELHDARSHLAERGDQLRALIAHQAAERHHVADELPGQAPRHWPAFSSACARSSGNLIPTLLHRSWTRCGRTSTALCARCAHSPSASDPQYSSSVSRQRWRRWLPKRAIVAAPR